MSDINYKVTLPRTFPANAHRRAGIAVAAGLEGYVGPLTDEQLEAIKADPILTVVTLVEEDTEGDAVVDLKKLTRTALEDFAKAAGVEATDQYNSKADLIAAIEAKQSAE